jgi:hypothetical protein
MASLAMVRELMTLSSDALALISPEEVGRWLQLQHSGSRADLM